MGKEDALLERREHSRLYKNFVGLEGGEPSTRESSLAGYDGPDQMRQSAEEPRGWGPSGLWLSQKDHHICTEMSEIRGRATSCGRVLSLVDRGRYPCLRFSARDISSSAPRAGLVTLTPEPQQLYGHPVTPTEKKTRSSAHPGARPARCQTRSTDTDRLSTDGATYTHRHSLLWHRPVK
jgi:hypothetical protein